jgi:hypothetical protein
MASLFRRLRRGKPEGDAAEPEPATEEELPTEPETVAPEPTSDESAPSVEEAPLPMPEEPEPTVPPTDGAPEAPAPPAPPPVDPLPEVPALGIEPPAEPPSAPPPLPERDDAAYSTTSAPSASTTCFICGSRLESGRCPTCQMTWIE